MSSAWWSVAWVWTTTGWSLVVVGAALLVWALFADRAKGRKRCPGCWYDLSGVPRRVGEGGEQEGVVCPECGRGIARERQMLRTRRKWRGVIGAAVVLLLGYAAMSVPAYQNGGWVRLIPSTALIVLAPCDASGGVMAGQNGVRGGGMGISPFAPPVPPTVDEQLESEVWRRVYACEMYAWQSQWFVGRVLREKGISLGSDVLVPVRWSAGAQIPVFIRGRTGAVLPGLALEPAWDARLTRPEAMRLADLPAHDVADAVHVALIEVALTCPNGSVYRTTIARPVAIVALDTDILRADDSEATTELARSALDPRLCVTPEGGVSVAMDDRSPKRPWRRVVMGLGCRVDVMLDGEVAGTCVHAPQWTRELFKDWNEPEIAWGPGMLERVRSAPERVVLRVRGEPRQSLEAYRVWPFADTDPECWTGEFEVQGRVVTRPEKFED